MVRYENVDTETLSLIDNIIKEEFPKLTNFQIFVIFDNKKKMNKGKIVAATIQKTNELNRFLSFNETDGEGYDYIMTIDKNIWEDINDLDRTRIVRHELMHCFIDDNGNHKIIGHDFEGFYKEIDIENKEGGDPRWKERISQIAESIYSKDD